MHSMQVRAGVPAQFVVVSSSTPAVRSARPVISCPFSKEIAAAECATMHCSSRSTTSECDCMITCPGAAELPAAYRAGQQTSGLLLPKNCQTVHASRLAAPTPALVFLAAAITLLVS